MLVLLALVFGVAAGLRTFTPLAAMGWATYLGLLPPGASWLGFLDGGVVAGIFTALAVAEYMVDQLPHVPSRRVPLQFGARLVSGALCGAAVAVPVGAELLCIPGGVVGAVLGTLGGAEMRRHMADAFGRDRPAALIEDAIAISLVVCGTVALPLAIAG